MENLIFQGWVRILVGTGIALLWYFWVRRKFLPSRNVGTNEGEDSAVTTPVKTEFPIFSFTGMVLLTLAFFWYANFELAYRDPTQKPDYSVQTQRDQERKARLSEEIPVVESDVETLQEKAQRMHDESEAENTKAKEEFEKLKPDHKKD